MSRLARLAQHEFTIWTLGLATAIVGHGAAASVLEHVEGGEPHAIVRWLVGFVVLTVIFYYLYENPLPQRLTRRLKWRISVIGLLPWLFGDAAVISLYGVAVLLHRDGLAAISTCEFAIYVVSLVVCSSGFFLLRRNLLVIHTRYLQSERITGDPARHSRGEHGPRHIIGILSTAAGFRDNDFLPYGITLSEPPDLAADLEMLAAAKTQRASPGDAAMPSVQRPSRPWPWEMLLRALWPHRTSVRELTLVCSRESLAEAPRFVAILRRYREFRGVGVNVWAEEGSIRSLHAADDDAALASLRGFDFGNLDEMSSAMTDLLKYLQLGRWIRAGEILIDFTGGTKPVSVVAAALTLRSEVRAQYVDTNDLWPTTYDLVSNPEGPAGA